MGLWLRRFLGAAVPPQAFGSVAGSWAQDRAPVVSAPRGGDMVCRAALPRGRQT